MIIITESNINATNDNKNLVSESIKTFFKQYETITNCFDFGLKWRKDNYARVSVGHKLTSALMLTHCPSEMEVRSPWEHWILDVPPGLCKYRISESGNSFVRPDSNEFGDEYNVEICCILCRGTNPYKLILRVKNDMFCSVDVTEHKHKELLTSYIKGVCLSIHDRKNVKEKSWAKKSNKFRGEPEWYGRSYILSRPVSIDFREEILNIFNGLKKDGPKVQFPVRGHWRDQACGKSLKDRKTIWIEPFWKGPEDARILLRGYCVK